MPLHMDLDPGDIHKLHNFEYADTAAREAAVLTDDDIGKVAKQTDNNTYWILIDTAPTWTAITNEAGGGGSVAQPSGFVGVDGYISFFTADNQVAGDNDLFWNRVTNSLELGHKLFIGTTSATASNAAAQLEISSNEYLAPPELTLSLFNNILSTADAVPQFIFRTAQGTAASPDYVDSGDRIGRIDFQGYYDGNDYAPAVRMDFNVGGTVGSSSMPGSFNLQTTAVGSLTPTSRLVVGADGDVGISTASPNARLEVEDGGTSSSVILKVTSDDANPIGMVIGNDSHSTSDTNGLQFHVDNSGIASIRAPNGGAINIKEDGGATAIYVDAAGDVGIGTSSPNEQLTVEGVLSLDQQSAPSTTAGYGKVYVKSDGKLYYISPEVSEVELSTAGGGGGVSATEGADGYLAFFTGSDAIAGDNDLFYNRVNGRLGIGTITPNAKLNVIAPTDDGTVAARFTGGEIGSRHIVMNPDGGSSGYTFTIDMQDAGTSIGHNSSNIPVTIQTASTDRMSVEGNGDVRIYGDLQVGADADPDATLDVQDDTARIIINSTGTTTDASLQFQNAGTAEWTLGFDDSDSDKFKIGQTSLTSGTAFVINSGGDVEITAGTLDLTSTTEGTFKSNIAASSGPVLEVTNDQIAIRQVTSGGDTRIFADYSSFHSYGIYHRNSDDTIHITRKDGTGLESWSETGPSGSTTTSSMIRFFMGSGNLQTIGQIAVGTASPNSNPRVVLVESDASPVGQLKIRQNSTGDAALYFSLNDVALWNVGIDNSDGDSFKISNDSSGADVGVNTRFLIEAGGNVGIGIASPEAGLHAGSTKLSTTHIGGGSYNSDYTLTVLSVNDSTPSMQIERRNSQTADLLNVGETAGEFLTIDNDGLVGIGTDTPAYLFEIAQATGVADEALVITHADSNIETAIYQSSTLSAIGTSTKYELLLMSGGVYGISMKRMVDQGSHLATHVGFGTRFPHEQLTIDGVISMRERQTSPADFDGYGALFVNASNELTYRSEGGTETNLLAAGGGSGDVTQTAGFTGADGYLAFFTGDKEIAGDNDLFYDRATGNFTIRSGNMGVNTPAAPGVPLDVNIDGVDGIGMRFLALGSTAFSFEVQNSPLGAILATANTRDLYLEPSGRTVIVNVPSGDPELAFAIGGTVGYTMGLDDTDSDKFKIGSTAVSTSTFFELDSSDGSVVLGHNGNVGIGSVTTIDEKLHIQATDPFIRLHTGGTWWNIGATSADGFFRLKWGGQDKIVISPVTGTPIRIEGPVGLNNLTAPPARFEGYGLVYEFDGDIFFKNDKDEEYLLNVGSILDGYGTGTVTGTGTSGEVSYWDGSSSQTSSGDFAFSTDVTNGPFLDVQNVSNNAGSDATIEINNYVNGTSSMAQLSIRGQNTGGGGNLRIRCTPTSGSIGNLGVHSDGGSITTPSSTWMDTWTGKLIIGPSANAPMYFVTNTTSDTDDSLVMTMTTDHKVGVRTTTVPHASVGAAMFAMDGTNASTDGPHMQFTTLNDNNPVVQLLNWAHDAIYWKFDAFYDGVHKSSSSTGSFELFKSGADFKIRGDVATAGAATTMNDIIVANASSLGVTFPQGQIAIGTGTLNSQVPIWSEVDHDLLTAHYIVNPNSGTSASAALRTIADAANFWHITYSSGRAGDLGNTGIGLADMNVLLGSAGSSLMLYTDNEAAIHFAPNTTTAMTISEIGNVGIGTVFPIEPLTVNGVIALEEQDSTPATADGYGKTYAHTDGTLHYANDAGLDQSVVTTTAGADGYLAFYDTSGTNIVGDNDLSWNRVSNKLGVGIDSGVTHKVTIQTHDHQALKLISADTGSTQFAIVNSDASKTYTLMTSGTASSLGGGFFTIYDGSSHVFRINTSGDIGIGRSSAANPLEVEGDASKTSSGDWAANSDARIKREVRTITGGLEIIKQLNPVAFKYTEDYMDKHPSLRNNDYYNFIAQEYQKVFPNSVKDSGEDGILQIETGPVRPHLVAAVQELSDTIDEQRKMIDELRKELEELKSK